MDAITHHAKELDKGTLFVPNDFSHCFSSFSAANIKFDSQHEILVLSHILKVYPFLCLCGYPQGLDVILCLPLTFPFQMVLWRDQTKPEMIFKLF